MFQRSALEPAYHQDSSVEYGILTYGVVAASLRASSCIVLLARKDISILILRTTNAQFALGPMWENVPKQMYRERARNKVIIHSTLNTTLASLQALTLVAIDDVVANEVPQAWGALALLTRTGSSPLRELSRVSARPLRLQADLCTTNRLDQPRTSSYIRKNQTRTFRLPVSSRSAFSASHRPLPRKSRAAASSGASSCSIAGQLRLQDGSEYRRVTSALPILRRANSLHMTVSLFRAFRFRGNYLGMILSGAAR